MKIVIVCKSAGTGCGIAEFNRYLSQPLNATLVNSVAKIHEPYDAGILVTEYNWHVNEYELEADIVALQSKAKNVVLQCHTVLRGSYLDWMPIKKIVMSPILQQRLYGSVMIQHFVHPVNVEDADPPSEIRVGTFGFAGPAKRMMELLDHGKKEKFDVKVLASINTSTPRQEEYTREYANELKKKYPDQVEVGFFTSEEIIRKMKECSHLMFARSGDCSISVSGAAHLAYNTKRPIILESKLMAPDLKGTYVKTIEKLNKDDLLTMKNIPTGGISVDDVAERYIKELQ